MIEQMHGYDMVDRIIDKAKPASEGVYTAVGSYPHEELVGLVLAYSELSQTPLYKALNAFGHHMLKFFSTKYPAFFEPRKDAFFIS